jgi:hypothetical protein
LRQFANRPSSGAASSVISHDRLRVRVVAECWLLEAFESPVIENNLPILAGCCAMIFG